MGIEVEIEKIREGITHGRFSNEASVSQGIVLRLLHALGWSTYDTDTVWPEYQLRAQRVDYALCSPPRKPIALIEVKQIGQSAGAERQLFEYAFHDGIPMAILTDGREWNFFLPGEQGDYGDRRVYKLDIVERDTKECSDRLLRYLQFSAVVSGAAMQAARDDYRNISKERQMSGTMPTAWNNIIGEPDELLLEIMADRVESLCGFRPEPDLIANFIKNNVATLRPLSTNQVKGATPAGQAIAFWTVPATGPTVGQPASGSILAHAHTKAAATQEQFGFTFEGQFRRARNAIDVLRQVFDLFIKRDPSFGDRFAGLPKHGRIRRYLAKDPDQLYPNRPDLVHEASIRLESGWWMGTNYSKYDIGKIISMACDVAKVAHGSELVAKLGD